MNTTPHILLVEDEPFIAKVVKDSLEQKGYSVIHSVDGKKAFNLFQHENFSLCVVDVMLPSLDGFTLVRQIRKINPGVPVLFLTAKTATADIMEGYSSGGNDYLKKPFSLEELYLRVYELLKRSGTRIEKSIAGMTIGKYSFVPHRQILCFQSGEGIKLSHKETLLLQMLVDHKNELLDRRLVLQAIWGEDTFFNARSMDVFITKLRKHLKLDPQVEILNIRGAGYKLIC